ncbi:hypothetical protein B0T16DRAFT_393081 [Cercophora newfieldiana]|uniref:Uncharacterized protein n=1 Tax=Cercophora newfieldiana TaxID=92897 RepID=A0AA39XV33_9PEZI|nr:hypothetical protein B0T16DRAFT_393081 [Cercophora newfieldiana]
MGKQSGLVLLLLHLTTTALSTDPPPDWELCPHWRGLHEPVYIPALPTFPPDWTEWPTNASRSVCATALNKHFSPSRNPHTTVTLHQTNQTWQRDPRKPQILPEIEDAITSGLELFGTHAGTVETPLQIHITITDTNTTLPSETQFGHPPNQQSYVFIDSEFAPYNDGIATPCNLIIVFPPPANTTLPFMQLLKKDIVKNMYHCVQYYHHPTLHVLGGADWWFQGIARFFDGVLWPAPAELIHDEKRVSQFPEEYRGYLSLDHYNAQACSLIWHWAYNSGWTLQDITDWMKRHPSKATWWEDEVVVMAADERFTRLFHSFGRAAVEGNISYPSGARINLIPPDWGHGDGPWDASDQWIARQTLQPGEQREVMNGGIRVDPWQIYRDIIPFAAGQVIEMSMRHKDYVVRRTYFPAGRTGLDGVWRDIKANITLAENATVLRDVEWSYRKRGRGRLVHVPWNETARIEVPSEGSQIEYEVVYTCAGGDYDWAHMDWVMKRI